MSDDDDNGIVNDEDAAPVDPALEALAALDWDVEARGFHNVAKAALELIVDAIFADCEPAFELVIFFFI